MATTDALADYKHKRDFARTPEPRAVVAKPKQSLSFVVQKHAARQLHYDFRLELDGSLKSWAVPKGPSLDPSVKRMAVHVEDHPLSYADFEGVIPPKQYGAGTVVVWDRGTWIPLEDARAGYRAGKLKFELRGVKLKGRWALVRMKRRPTERQEAWLLIKEDDEAARPSSEFDVVQAMPDSVLGGAPSAAATKPESKGVAPRKTRTARGAAPKRHALTKQLFGKPGARQRAATAGPPLPANAVPAPLPLTLAPQLAVLVDRVPERGDWLYEIKFDGYRLATRIEGSQVRCYTRNGNDWSAKLPALVKDLQALGLQSAWIDGEIVAAGSKGTPDFQALQNAFDGRHTERLQYYVFDLPYFAGYDLRDVPLHERRAVLSALIGASAPPSIRYSETFDAPADRLLESARKLGLEGLIGKRKDAVYRSRRSPDWIKLKCSQRQEFVIGGYTEPKGSRTGLGALLLGVHDAASGKLRYAGNAGTGFNEETLHDLKRRLERLHAPSSPFVDVPRSVKANWVRPELVAEVSFSEWTRDGRIRHPAFRGLRSDKPAAAITREAPVAAPQAVSRRAAQAPAPGPRITNPQRVIDASSGVTKGDLVRYYASVAQLMLPHLHERPVALLRAPRGVKGPTFFQKHIDSAGAMPQVDRLDPSLDPDHEPMLGISSAEALASIAQMNVIEVHTWNATTRAIDRPDRIVFDLDPGEGVGWSQVQQAAQLLHAFLDELELASLLKTSGGKGLHVLVPLVPEHDWDTVKQLAQAIVVHLATVIPERFVAKSGPKNRVGRIYIDYLRNAFGATTVAAWSARARPGLGVSVPVAWDELDTLRSGAHWSVATIGERVAQGNAPWDAYEASRQKLARAMKQLGIDPSRR